MAPGVGCPPGGPSAGSWCRLGGRSAAAGLCIECPPPEIQTSGCAINTPTSGSGESLELIS